MKLNFISIPALAIASFTITAAFWFVAESGRSYVIPLSGFVARSYVSGHEVFAFASNDFEYSGFPAPLKFGS